MATIQLETPARAGPVGFQAGKAFLSQTQRRDLSSREGYPSVWVLVERGLGAFAESRPREEAGDFLLTLVGFNFTGLKNLRGICAKAPEKFQV